MTVLECLAICKSLSFDVLSDEPALTFPVLNRVLNQLYLLFPVITGYEMTVPVGNSEWNLFDLTDDFGRLAAVPIRDGTLYDLMGEGRIRIVSEKEKTVTVFYEKKAPVLKAGDETVALPLPDYLLPLVPLAVTSALLVEEDPEKATYYQSQYASELAAAHSRRTPGFTTFAQNLNGW